MYGTEGQEFRDFVTARTSALLGYAHQLTGETEPTRSREIVTDALAETGRHWRRARRTGPEEYTRVAIERRVRRARRRGALPPAEPPTEPPAEPGAEPLETPAGPSGAGPRRTARSDSAPGAGPRLPPPADPVTPVLARAGHQRRRRLVGVAAAAVIALVGAGVIAALDEESRPPPGPPAEVGLLPWSPRGDAAADAGVVAAASGAWRRHAGPGRPAGEVYVLYAGHPVEGSVALLQARDAGGRAWVAQLHPADADDRDWRVDRVRRITSTSLSALVVDQDLGATVSKLHAAPPVRQRRVQLLVAPSLTGVGVSLLTRQAPTTPGHVWVYQQIRSDGLSGSWRQPYGGGREGESVFAFSRDDGPGTIVIEMGMVSGGADTLPEAPPVSLVTGSWMSASGPGEFTNWLAGAYDDSLAARGVLRRSRLTVAPVITPISGAPGPRAALMYVLAGHDAWLVTVVRQRSELVCASAQDLEDGDIPRRVAAGRCVPDEGPYPGFLLVATLDEVTRVRYEAEAARPGERAYRGQLTPARARDGGVTVPLEPRETAPTGRATVVAYDGGDEYGRWTIPRVRRSG